MENLLFVFLASCNDSIFFKKPVSVDVVTLSYSCFLYRFSWQRGRTRTGGGIAFFLVFLHVLLNKKKHICICIYIAVFMNPLELPN